MEFSSESPIRRACRRALSAQMVGREFSAGLVFSIRWSDASTRSRGVSSRRFRRLTTLRAVILQSSDIVIFLVVRTNEFGERGAQPSFRNRDIHDRTSEPINGLNDLAGWRSIIS